MFDTGVIGNKIENHSDISGVGFGHQAVEIAHVAKHRVDGAVVSHVITKICHRRGEERRDPYEVNTKLGQMIEVGNGASEVTNAVTIGIGKGPDVQAVPNRTVPPARGGFTASRQSVGLHRHRPESMTGYCRGQTWPSNCESHEWSMT